MADAVRLHTRETVESALVTAYAELEGRPCMTQGARLVEGHAPPAALALNWVADHVPDRREAAALLSWVRCRAKSESWRAFCCGMGWEIRTEDRRRERAALRIVGGLNIGVDSVSTGVGAMMAGAA